MRLVWKLLRQHISVSQFVGFFFANLFGMFIVMLGYQFYRDVLPVFTSGDSFMRADYLIVSKRIGTTSTLSGRSNAFSSVERDDVGRQPFVKKIGAFKSTEYKVSATMGVGGSQVLNSEIFFESVPDEFIDVPLAQWQWKPGDSELPIILPRTYINMYNFGYAQSHSLPKISDGLMGMIQLDIFIHGNGHQDNYKGRVVGFSTRLNTILVPQSFLEWSNNHYAPDANSDPTRLLVEVDNPTDERISKYFDNHGYEMETDKLDAEKTTYFLRMTASLVMVVGLVISLLSFYILMLSIYLLVEKNSTKLENLLLIGYSPRSVALPYQLLTVGLNLAVLLLSLLMLHFTRNYYMGVITTLFPQIDDGSMLPAVAVGLILFAIVTIVNQVAIRRKVMRIWKRKD